MADENLATGPSQPPPPPPPPPITPQPVILIMGGTTWPQRLTVRNGVMTDFFKPMLTAEELAGVNAFDADVAISSHRVHLYALCINNRKNYQFNLVHKHKGTNRIRVRTLEGQWGRFVRNMNLGDGESVEFSWDANPRRLKVSVSRAIPRGPRSARVRHEGPTTGLPPIDGDLPATLCLGTKMGTIPISSVMTHTRQATEHKIGLGIDVLFWTDLRERGVAILVFSRGILGDLSDTSTVSFQLLAFDEADKMLDMGFERAYLPPRDVRQTMLFIANFPKEIEQTNTYVFVESKKEVHRSDHRLGTYGFPVTSFYSDRAHQERLALRLCKCGHTIQVATDVAARGLTVDLANDINDAACCNGCTRTNQEEPDWLLCYASFASYGEGQIRRFGGHCCFGGNNRVGSGCDPGSSSACDQPL